MLQRFSSAADGEACAGDGEAAAGPDSGDAVLGAAGSSTRRRAARGSRSRRSKERRRGPGGCWCASGGGARGARAACHWAISDAAESWLHGRGGGGGLRRRGRQSLRRRASGRASVLAGRAGGASRPRAIGEDSAQASASAMVLAARADSVVQTGAESAQERASATEAAAWAGMPTEAAAASRSAMGVARGLWMGAKMISSKRGKRIWAISARGLSRRQLKSSVAGWAASSSESEFGLRRAARRAQAPAGLWATSRTHCAACGGARPFGVSERDGVMRTSRRPGHSGGADSGSMETGRDGEVVVGGEFDGGGEGEGDVAMLVAPWRGESTWMVGRGPRRDRSCSAQLGGRICRP